MCFLTCTYKEGGSFGFLLLAKRDIELYAAGQAIRKNTLNKIMTIKPLEAKVSWII